MSWLRSLLLASIGWMPVTGVAEETLALPDDYCQWQARDYSIDRPLCGLTSDSQQGRRIAADSHLGNCLACHRMPIPEESLHGTLGPPLDGLASRMTEGQIRLRVVDERQINPNTIMPGFYRDPRLANRVADEYWGKTFLCAQEVEDLVAYLKTLR